MPHYKSLIDQVNCWIPLCVNAHRLRLAPKTRKMDEKGQYPAILSERA